MPDNLTVIYTINLPTNYDYNRAILQMFKTFLFHRLMQDKERKKNEGLRLGSGWRCPYSSNDASEKPPCEELRVEADAC